jgi:hypothetical protein
MDAKDKMKVMREVEFTRDSISMIICTDGKLYAASYSIPVMARMLTKKRFDGMIERILKRNIIRLYGKGVLKHARKKSL